MNCQNMWDLKILNMVKIIYIDNATAFSGTI